MALLTPGYFPSTYWADSYWTDNYWGEYGYVSGTIASVFMIRKAGTPTTGLTPTVDVFLKVSDGSSAGAAPSVTEIGGGFYKFMHNIAQETVVRVDSGDVTMNDEDRYTSGVITPYDGTTPPTAVEIRTEMDANSTKLAGAATATKLKQHDNKITGLVV